jgi:hypothetical protein
VIDHFPQVRVRNLSAKVDRIPMLFVHVIAGTDLFVSIAQFKREIGITFQIHRCRIFIERGQREHFATYFENENVLTEWRALSSA